jgi:uncharacterized OsmC-like protein
MNYLPSPLGEGRGSSPVQLLAAAVVNCLSEEGRVRVLKIEAKLHLGVDADKLEHLDRVLEQFEDFCTVTQSVGQGIPIHTRVLDSKGVILKD